MYSELIFITTEKYRRIIMAIKSTEIKQRIKGFIASILAIFGKKETAESLFSKRAASVATKLEKIRESLKGEEQARIGAVVGVLDKARDTFVDFSLDEVNNVFGNIDRITEAIKASTAERVSFSGGEIHVNTLEKAIKTYIRIIEFYVQNTIKRNDPNLKGFNIDNILRAAKVSSAIEEIEAAKKDMVNTIYNTQSEINELKRKESLGHSELVKDIKILEYKLEGHKNGYIKICNELESAIKYQAMLEAFLAGRIIEENPNVEDIYKNAEDLAWQLKDDNVENETRKMKMDQYRDIAGTTPKK